MSFFIPARKAVDARQEVVEEEKEEEEEEEEEEGKMIVRQ